MTWFEKLTPNIPHITWAVSLAEAEKDFSVWGFKRSPPACGTLKGTFAKQLSDEGCQHTLNTLGQGALACSSRDQGPGGGGGG